MKIVPSEISEVYWAFFCTSHLLMLSLFKGVLVVFFFSINGMICSEKLCLSLTGFILLAYYNHVERW